MEVFSRLFGKIRFYYRNLIMLYTTPRSFSQHPPCLYIHWPVSFIIKNAIKPSISPNTFLAHYIVLCNTPLRLPADIRSGGHASKRVVSVIAQTFIIIRLREIQSLRHSKNALTLISITSNIRPIIIKCLAIGRYHRI